MNRLQQQLDFILELDKLKAVYRRVTVKADRDRFENSAEHSWHISLMAEILVEYVEEPVNIHRVVRMLLIHDVVEIDAGDTFAFAAQEELDGQPDKELAAADRLFGLLPEDQFRQIKALWLEFEAAQTTDARFAKAMDRVLPVLQNLSNKGGSWIQYNISRAQVLKRNEGLKELAPRLWSYIKKQVDQATEQGLLA